MNNLKIVTKSTTKDGSQFGAQRKLTVEVSDDKLNEAGQFTFTHSTHSYERSIQRSINDDVMSVAFTYGEAYFKQGLIFYVIGENNLPDFIEPKNRKKYKNLVVVVSGDSDEIITCYKNSDPFRYIKKKSKRLSKRHFNNAA
jgi:hypothetical protein